MKLLRHALLATALLATPAAAQQAPALRIGVQAIATSMDPHFHNLSANIQLQHHIFEPLVMEDPSGVLRPRLATAWRAIDATTWEITLREGVRFHDGTPFVAEDVTFSFARVPEVPGSPGPFTTHTRPVVSMEVAGPHTLRLRTAQAHPLLPRDLAMIMILSRQLHTGRRTEEFNSGAATIGTGPYRFVRYVPGESLELTRSDTHWAPAEPWSRVTVRALRQDSSRVAALLAGDVDLIDMVPLQDLGRLRGARGIAIASTPSAQTFYLFPDAAREVAPFITGRDGRPLASNPLRDLRVRQAISMAINRDAIVARIMDGAAAPAGGLTPPGLEGGDPAQRPPPYDPDRARRLLAEAGYPEGFTITLHGSANWVINDDRVVQAVAQMLTRIGIEARVETFPSNVLLPRATNREFPLFFASWIGTTAANPLRSMLATRDPARGMGPANRQHYSNPAFDAALDLALATMDDAQRHQRLAAAMRIAMDDVAVIPLIHPANNWATVAARVTYTANPIGRTQAMLARP